MTFVVFAVRGDGCACFIQALVPFGNTMTMRGLAAHQLILGTPIPRPLSRFVSNMPSGDLFGARYQRDMVWACRL